MATKPKVGEIQAKKPRFELVEGDPSQFEMVNFYSPAPSTAAEQEAPERSMIRAAGDLGLSLGQGAIGSVKALTDIAGADNAASQTLGSMSEYLGNQKSEQSKATLKASQERVKDAEETGSTWEEAKAYLGMLWDQPGEFLAQGVGSFATLGLGKIAQAAKLASAAKAAGVSKDVFLASAAGKKAIEEAVKFGFKANVGIGAAQGVGAVKGSQYEQTYNNAIAKGMPEEEARALATEAQRYGGSGTMQQLLGGGLGGLAAATGPIERLVAGKAGREAATGTMAAMGKGFLVEGGTEGLQGGQERYAGNTAAIDAGVMDPAKRWQGVGGQFAMEGTIGGVIGAAAGPFEAQAPINIPARNPAQEAADAIRATKMPESGPMTRAVNAQTEQAAREAEARARALAEQEMGEPMVPQTTPPDGRAILDAQEAKARAAREAEIAASRAVQTPDDEILQSTGAMQDFMAREPAPPVEPTPEPAAPVAAEPAAEPAPRRTLADMSDDELRTFQRNAQDAGIRKQVSAEIARRKREAIPDPLAAPTDLFAQPEQAANPAAEPPAAQKPADMPEQLAQRGDIYGPTGDPFKTFKAAEIASKKTTGSVVKVPGGFVIRPQESTLANTQAQDAAAEAGQAVDTAAAAGTGDGQAAASGVGQQEPMGALSPVQDESTPVNEPRSNGTNPGQSPSATPVNLPLKPRSNEQATPVNRVGNPGEGTPANVQDAPQTTTGAPATTGAETTEAQAAPAQAPEAARGDGAAAAGVPDARGTGDAQANVVMPAWADMTPDQRKRARLEQEITTGTTNNGGVIGKLRPSAIEKRKQELAQMGEAGRLPDLSKNQPNLNTSAEPAQKTAESEQVEPFEHAGLKIRTTRTKVGNEVVDGWLIQSPENAEREARGERQIGGDRIVETREQAIKTADQEAKRYAKEKADRAEMDAREKAERDAAEAKKEANRGKTLLERRADAILDKQIRESSTGDVITRREWIERRVKEGLEPKVTREDKIKPMSRMQAFRSDNRQQAEHDKKVKEAGKKDVYWLGGFEITKTEYDYVQKVKANQPTESKPDQEPAQSEQQAEIGSFGPILTQYRGDAKGAIKALTELKDGEAVAALSHPEIGDIDLVWGKEGTRESNGFGLAKLVKWHPEVLDDLQGVVSSLDVVERSENRIQLESDKHKAAVRLEWDKQAKHWLLTAFEKKEAGGGTRTDTAASSVGDDTARPNAGPVSVSQQPNGDKFTAADAQAAERQLAQMIGDRIDAMQAQAVQKIGAKFLPTMGVKAPIGKAKIKAAVTDFTKVNPLAAASEFGVEIADSVRAPLLAQQEAQQAGDFNAQAAWDAMTPAARGAMLDKWAGAGQTDMGERYKSRAWGSFNAGEKGTLAAVLKAAQEPATDDRDTFTLKRLNRETGRMEPVMFKRGEYVEVTLIGSDKKDYGEIDGISQARREFSVNGLWHTMAAAYKAERPAAPVRKDMAPLSSVIDKMNAKNGEGLTEADRVPEQKPASKTPTVDRHKEVMQAVREGKAGAEQFKDSFEDMVNNKAAVLAELGTMTKAQLLDGLGGWSRQRYANDAKPEVVDAVYRGLVGEYVLGETLSYGMGKGAYEAAVRKVVEATDDAKLAKYVEDRKAAIAEALENHKARAAALENPQTLDDFRSVVKARMLEGKNRKEAFLSLTPEQRIKYDELEAESTKEAREARKRAAKTEVRAAGQTTGGEIIATKHTRDGYDLFVVQLADRLSKEDYNTVLASAKRLGGWYSSFRGNGAIPGFQFKDKANAEAFLKLAGGDTTDAQAQAQQRRDAFDDDRSQSAMERLREMADKIEASAEEDMNRERKTNTARRARFAANAERAAAAERALARTMRNIAQAIEDGKAKFLDAVRTKTQVEALAGYVNTAKYNELRAKYPSYADQEKRRGEPPSAETADFAEFPSFTAYRSDLAALARQMLEVEGTKKLGAQLMKVADDVTDAYLEFAKKPENLLRLSTFSIKRGDEVKAAIFPNREQAERAIQRSGLTGKAIVLAEKRGVNRIIMSPSEAMNQKIWTGDGDKRITLTVDFGNELVEAIGRRGSKQNGLTVPWQFQTAHDRRKALARMGIETAAEFRSALREFIALHERATANKVREMELAMVGRKSDGLDFFPTPAEVADQMVEAADIKPDMAVLEPSAGMGHIADRIRAAGAEPDVVEISPDRRDLLLEKGYHIAESNDFMAMQPREFFTYGDIFRAPDGTEGIMRGVSQSRVRLEDENGNRLGLYDRDELTGIGHRGSWSGYDRIVMNPPFSKRQDAEHVMHAYKLLKPGGRIVAIMGEGVFFGQDKKAQEFREWLDSVGGTSEKLPEGSFMDPSLPVNTSVNARMVVIDKPAGDLQFSVVDDGTGPADTADYGPATQAHRDAARRLSESFAQRVEGGGPDLDLLDAVAPGDGKRGQTAAAVASIARRLFGREVVFVKFKGKPLFNGVVSKNVPGTIFLNIDSQKPLLAVLGHELLHEMAKSQPTMYANLSRRLDNLIKNETEYGIRTVNAYKAAGISLKGLDTREELEADIVGDNFMDAGFWQAMGENQPGLFKRIVNFVTQWLDNLANKVAGYRPFGTDEFLTDIAAAREAVASAMREFSGAEVGAVADPVGADVKLSASNTGSGATNGDALREFRETESRLGGYEAYSAAKDADATELTYKQWVQVRTPSFKKWWGYDWETDIRATAGGRFAAGDGPAEAGAGAGAAASGRQDARGAAGAQAGQDGRSDLFRNPRTGEPRVFFHGTRDRFTVFDVDHPNKKDHGWLGRGHYFTTDASIADTYARIKAGDGEKSVMEVFVRPNNPKLMTVQQKLRFARFSKEGIDKLTTVLKQDGHGGAALQFEDGEIEVMTFDQAGIKSATDNAGTFDDQNPDIRFSVVDDIRQAYVDRVPQGVQDRLSDMTTSQRGFNRWWHGTVGTQLHKAKTNKEFGKVYYAVQDFMKDVSRMATIAADEAPDLLPQIEGLADIKKVMPQMGIAGHRQRKADMKAASDALFDGTLRYTRDGYGEPVEAQNVEDAGIVWTDKELQDRGLNNEAIKLYRQARAAINQSLDNLMAADVYRMLTAANPEVLADNFLDHEMLLARIRKAAASDRPMTALAEAGKAMDKQAEKLRKQIRAMKKEMESDNYAEGLAEAMAAATGELKKITDLKDRMEEKAERVRELKSNGYAPLSRFGRYAVDVLDENGQRAFFGLYETQYAANRAARRFAEQGFSVSQSVKSAKEFEMLKGVSPETAMLFAELLGVEKDEAMQKWLQNAVAEQSALKRQIRRKGVAGFDDDAGRVVAAFITSNSRAASRALHSLRIQERVENVRAGDVKDEAIKLAEYVNNPTEEAQAVRSLLFINYIGGSVASALVNLTQTVVQTFPYLAQYGGARKGAARVTQAMKLAMGKIEDADLAAAVKRAEEDGVIKPQEVFQLQAEASRTMGSDIRLRAGLALWGSFFQMAETFNRRVAFIAAYQTAKQEGMANPFGFAENAVDETQGVFNKGNRPNWARGAIGATLFTFKTFTVQYVEFLKRLPPKERALALGVLVLLAGVRGLPFAEDAEDVVDTVAQGLGYNFTTKEQMDRFLVATLGRPFADFLQHGASGTGLLPFDVSQRLGMADLLPATGVLKPSETRKEDQLLEIGGVAGSFIRDYAIKGLPEYLSGDIEGALQKRAAPSALVNAYLGWKMYSEGIYTDTRGRKVMDVSPLDAAMKGIGLQPAGVAAESRAAGTAFEKRALFSKVKSEITEQMALGQFENDKAKIQAARERLADWNRKNPDAQIVLSGQAVRRRVTEMRRDRADRLVRSTPKELRAQVREVVE